MQTDGPRQDATVALETGTALLPETPPIEAVRQAVYAATRVLLIERLRIATLLVGISITFFLFQDLFFFSASLSLLLPLKCAQFAFIAAVLLVIRRGWVPGDGVVFAVVVTGLSSFFAAAAGIVRGSTSGSALLFIVVTAGVAIGFPWGARAQAAVATICALLLTWTDYEIHGALLPAISVSATGSMVVAGFVSVFVAHSVERYRWQLEEREMGLRLREECFRSLIENGGDLILAVGADGRCRYVSPSVARLLGYGLADWMGVSLFDFVHADDAARLRQAMETSEPEGGSVRTVEVRLRDASGGWRTLEAAIANLLANPAVRGFVFNARDVTARRQMESDLRRSQSELTHVLRLGTIGEIASALAHEINQPLAAIANYASTCARWLDAGRTSSSEHRRSLDLIAAEALRAGRIVHNLRDLSRKRDVGLSLVDVNDVVRRATELMAPQARQLGISLRLETSEGLPPVYADAIQIEQVVLNLLLNGLESMLASKVRVLTVSTLGRDDGVDVRVRDTGAGLDPEIGERVFEPFVTTKPTGLGMGLAISRRIVEAHGGDFGGASNDDGRGCTFHFSLPHASPAEREAHERESAPL